MVFSHISARLLDGEPVTRDAWSDGGQIHLANGRFHYTDDTNAPEPYELTTADILAGDWQGVNVTMTETPIPMIEGTPPVPQPWAPKFGLNPFE